MNEDRTLRKDTGPKIARGWYYFACPDIRTHKINKEWKVGIKADNKFEPSTRRPEKIITS